MMMLARAREDITSDGDSGCEHDMQDLVEVDNKKVIRYGTGTSMCAWHAECCKQRLEMHVVVWR